MTSFELEMSFQIRERIEPLLLGNSIPNLSQDDIDDMHRIQDEIEANTDVERFLALNRAFHWASYRGHNAPQLAGIIERLWDTTQSYRRTYVELALHNKAEVINAEHRLLLEAIGRRDYETAASVLATHIRRTRINLRERRLLVADEPG